MTSRSAGLDTDQASGPGPYRPRRPRSLRKFEPIIWLLPSLLLIGGVVLYPAIDMISTSLSRITRSGLNRGYDGLANYARLFQEPELGPVFFRTMLWVVLTVGITTVIALALAQLLNAQFPGRRLLRFSLILPWAAAVAVTTLSWKWMLNYYYGVVNEILLGFRLLSEPIDWVGGQSTSFATLIIIGVFLSVPFTAYVLLAGLQTIPNDLYEAARVDGASGRRLYVAITLPLLRPSLIVTTVLNAIFTFNSFTVIWVMTRGGPGASTATSTTFAYQLAFGRGSIGESAALNVINIIFLMSASLGYVLLINRRRQL